MTQDELKCPKDGEKMRKPEPSQTYVNPNNPEIYLHDCGTVVYKFPIQHAWESSGITVVQLGTD